MKIILYLAVGLGLLVSAVMLFFWATIPEAPDPVALPSSVLDPPSDQYLDAVGEGRTLARTLLAEEKLPGLSLAVAVGGEVVWAEGFRWAEMATETPVTPETLFRVGGVSSALTAAAVGALVDRGLIDLDLPVQTYLPGFPEKSGPVTTRQLMTHTAGIRPQRGEATLIPMRACGNTADQLALVADDSLEFRPGTDVAYSAYGWVVTGAVIAAAAGEPYLDFLEREVLVPLGLESTIPDLAEVEEPGSAHFYFPRAALNPALGLQDAPRIDLSCVLPASGFLSTPSDLVRLASAMMEGDRFSAATSEEFWSPVALTGGGPAGQTLFGELAEIQGGNAGSSTQIVGLGLGAAVTRSLLSANGTGGGISGGTASLIAVPEHRVAIAVATNVSASANVSVIAAGLAAIFAR